MDFTDLTHRILWTFIQATAGVFTSVNLADLDMTQAQQVATSAVAAGIAAVIVVLKEIARNQLMKAAGAAAAAAEPLHEQGNHITVSLPPGVDGEAIAAAIRRYEAEGGGE